MIRKQVHGGSEENDRAVAFCPWIEYLGEETEVGNCGSAEV